ncbi:MAG TPA: hypothetical protein PLG34_09570 [Spirochaetota bacterium]|jgi:hypothetical protein|nr:MAG: hypothetical protein BWX91_01373 [Spirochaetes bacterium ADurb.Bin133]HNZ26701.1 hypothetical protein [Spirochaetota bacterium]HPY88218.1 hypothetical protein [Spirochaetota bacterium]
MKKYFILFLISITISAFSADNSSDDWKEKSKKFALDSIAKDIAKSDFNHLKSMANSLKLKNLNNDAEYRTALYKYFGIVNPVNIESPKQGDKIILERAGELKMTKFTEDNEEILHLFGKVRLVLNGKDDKNQTVTRTIHADEIFIDLKNKELTGTGNVVFKDSELEFSGKHFFYNFEINRGVLFDGRTKLLQGGDSGLAGAFFKGEKILQTDTDDAVLSKGQLTTCDNENPHYSLTVSKMWINQKGEWGILNGAIYIGPIPFFYIPIYYHPKSLNINPSFGFRSREGWFLNTTYYILGKEEEVKKDSKDVFGVSQNRADPSTEKAYMRISKKSIDEKLDSFYNKYDFYKKYPKAKIYPNFQNLDLSLRVFGDAYTNLGFYTGSYFFLRMDDKYFPVKLSILSDFGFSRLIWKDTAGDVYIPYNPLHKNPSTFSTLGSSNTYSNLAANPLTIRTSQWLFVDGQIAPNLMSLKYTFQMEYVTDYDYFRDFYNRSRYFSYIDVMFDAIQYGIQSSSDGNADVFTAKVDEKVSGKSSTNTFLKLAFSPKSIPDIFGLKPISSISLNAESDVNMIKTSVKEFQKDVYTDDSTSYVDPKSYRFHLYSFTAPSANFSMRGELLNFKAIKEVPGKIDAKIKEDKKKKSMTKDDTLKDNLYKPIVEINLIDASGDPKEINYRDLLPFYSVKSKKKVVTKQIEIKNDYNSPAFEGKIVKMEKNKKNAVDNKTIKTRADYEKIYAPNMTPVKNVTGSTGLNIIDFNLTYNFSDNLVNKYMFDNDDVSDDHPEHDTVEEIFLNEFDPSKAVESLTLTNYLTFTLNGSLWLQAYSSSGKIWQMNPNFNVYYKKNWDDMTIYRAYLEKIYSNVSNVVTRNNNIQTNLDNKDKNNRNISELSIYYDDTIRNDLAFGSPMFEGTGINTYMKFRIFKHNEQRKYNFDLLNEKNANNPIYMPVDSTYYDNMVSYEKIESLYTNFSLKLNVFPKGGAHTLNFSVGPKINWIIPSAILSEMKNLIWNDQSSDVSYDAEVLNEAKDYIYYKNGGENINNKINSFYERANFWEGPKYFRKMFEDISFNMNYSFVRNSISIVSLTNTLVFRLDNMGSFSKGDGDPNNPDPFAIYPNESFSISLFNSIISYSLGISFSKELDNTVAVPTDKQSFDEYKIMVMTQTHSFNFTLNGNLFAYKIDKNWLSLSLASTFKWNRNINWSTPNGFNDFYYDSQSINLKIFKDIFALTLNFKYFDFKDGGYGFELDSGSMQLGYNITEIPVFLTYFKLTINPSISYQFNVKHRQYYEGAYMREYNISYYSNNSLTFYLGLDLIIGEKTEFETKIHFHTKSVNKKMYRYYSDQGIVDFFTDLANSFNFGDINKRKSSNFNLQEIAVSVEHNLHDWTLIFQYVGKPEKPDNVNRFYWENTFTFAVNWKIDSENQLLKMFNKTKVDEKYEKGKWKNRNLSLEAEE